MRKLSAIFFALTVIHLGVSSPQATSTSKNNSQTATTKKQFSVATPQSFGDSIARMFKKKEAVAVREKSTNATVGTGSTAAGGFAAQSVTPGRVIRPEAVVMPVVRPVSVVKPATIASPSSGVAVVKPPLPVTNVLKVNYAPPPPVQRVQLPQIRQEVQNIMKINQKITTAQTGQTAQFQRIKEQASIHEKILNEIESSRQEGELPKTPDRESLLAQEKLRIIHEEAQRNNQMLQEQMRDTTFSKMQNGIPGTEPSTSESQETE